MLMVSSNSSSRLYIILILIFAVMISFIMSVQLQNDWYQPEHRSCSSIELTSQICMTSSQQLSYEFSTTRNSPNVQVRATYSQDGSQTTDFLGEIESGRRVRGTLSSSPEYRFRFYRGELTCHSFTQELELQEIPNC